MITWYQVESGYILEKIYDRNYRNEGLFYGFAGPLCDQVISSDGHIISGDLTDLDMIHTGIIDSPYILVESKEAYYLLNQETHEVKSIGTHASMIEGSPYLIAYEEDDLKSKISLYQIGQSLDLLDQVNIPFIGGRLDSEYQGQALLVYENTNGTIGHFMNNMIKIRVLNNKLDMALSTNETYELYEKADYKSSVVKSVSKDQNITLINDRTYQLKDDQIIRWFEIQIDNQNYYIYKNLKDTSNRSYSFERLDIVLEDSSIIGFDTGGECANYIVRDHLGSKGYFTIYHAWEGTPSGYYINMKTGHIRERMPFNPKLSPNGQLMASYTFGYEGSFIKIHSISDDQFETIAGFDLNLWSVDDMEWIDDHKILVTVDDYNYELLRELYLINKDGRWQLEAKE